MTASTPRPRLLILGSGFAAFRLLKEIDARAYAVTVVSRRNHFLFTPLLPSTAVGTIEYRTILEPVRRAKRGPRFFQAEVVALDPSVRTVRCRAADGDLTWDEPYDLLAIAVGAENATYGIPCVREHACFLKELADARTIRQRVLGCLERASLPAVGDEERRRLVHFVAVGAGPTGVRFAAELYDLLAHDLLRSYPELAGLVRVTLLEAGRTILSAFEESLREYTARHFRRHNITVRTGTPVAEVGPGYVRLKDGEVLPAGVVLWCTGFAPCPFVVGLPWAKDRAGRLLTDEYLRVPEADGVYALGDCACPRGQNLPQLAQVAEQQGRYLGRALNRRAAGRPAEPFRWRNLGFSSYIGDRAAVVQSPGGGGRWAGFVAYQLWRSAIFTQLVSVKNKVLVPLSRLRTAVFGRDMSKF
jgi:NADH:ubiquinone reductase (non-electrogenic)